MVAVVDLFDFDGSFPPDLPQIVGPSNPLIVVANKADLLPGRANSARGRRPDKVGGVCLRGDGVARAARGAAEGRMLIQPASSRRERERQRLVRREYDRLDVGALTRERSRVRRTRAAVGEALPPVRVVAVHVKDPSLPVPHAG